MIKVFPSADDAVADIPSGATIAIGGFFTCGTPTLLTRALAKRNIRNLTIVIQSFGVGADEVNELAENGQVSGVIGNYPFYRSVDRGNQHLFEKLVRSGKINVEVYPMGTFVEKMRAGGAGIAAFYVPTGVGTLIAEGKETRIFNGREYIMETALVPDFALIHAWKGDYEGNLVYRKTARNYNVAMAMSAKITIAEVEQLYQPGSIEPDIIHTPGIYVKRVIRVDCLERPPSAT